MFTRWVAKALQRELVAGPESLESGFGWSAFVAEMKPLIGFYGN